MRFAEPSWIVAGLFTCVAVVGLMLWSARQRRVALLRFVSAERAGELTASVSPARRRLKATLLVVGLACVFVALARPQWGYHTEVRQRVGADLLVAVDTSKSMLAQDLRPSRLARAKLAVHDLLEKLPDARVGVIAFAGDAFLQAPLTFDRSAIRESIDAMDTEIIPAGGTNIESAIHIAERAAGSEPGRRKTLVILTDGEELSGSAVAAARDAATRGLTIHTIGIGSAQGSTIPVRTKAGQPELLRDPAGELVRTRLDEAALLDIAHATEGTYHALGATSDGLQALYRDALSKLPTKKGEEQTERVYHERFQLPLALGLLMLMLEWLLGDRRRRTPNVLPGASGAVAAAIPFALFFALTPALAGAQEEAVTEYNEATRSYRAGDFDEAVEQYRSALDTRDLSLQQRTYYDLGNALYRLGESSAKEARSTQIARYREAIRAFDAALALRADDPDARFNRDFVAKKLAELEREEPKSDKQQSPSGQQQSPSGQQQQQGGSEQGQQNQQPQQGQQGQQNQQPQQGQQGQQNQQPQQGQQNQPEHSEQQEAQMQQNGSTEERDGEQGAGLTRAEAAHLLQSLEGELRRLPSGYAGTKRTDLEQHGKDW